jgi:hypothetical protein
VFWLARFRFGFHEAMVARLSVTPATEAGLTDHVWTIKEMPDKACLNEEWILLLQTLQIFGGLPILPGIHAS